MKFLTNSEAVDWCKSNQIPLDERQRPVLAKGLKTFKIPKDAGQKIGTVKNHFINFKKEDEILVWIKDWSVWPSSERPHIFYKFRQSYGESRLLKEIPAHVCSRTEFEDCLSLVTLSVLFLWDCYVIGKMTRNIVFYSHHSLILRGRR